MMIAGPVDHGLGFVIIVLASPAATCRELTVAKANCTGLVIDKFADVPLLAQFVPSRSECFENLAQIVLFCFMENRDRTKQ